MATVDFFIYNLTVSSQESDVGRRICVHFDAGSTPGQHFDALYIITGQTGITLYALATCLGLEASAGVCLRAEESEISAA